MPFTREHSFLYLHCNGTSVAAAVVIVRQKFYGRLSLVELPQKSVSILALIFDRLGVTTSMFFLFQIYKLF